MIMSNEIILRKDRYVRLEKGAPSSEIVNPDNSVLIVVHLFLADE